MTFEELREVLKNTDEKYGIENNPDNFSTLLNMTDEQAADIIEDMYFGEHLVGGRQHGKQYIIAARMVATLKAIRKLRGEEISHKAN